MTYLDYNTAAPLRKDVLKAINFSNFGNPSAAVTQIGINAKQAIEEAREKVAKAFGVDKKFIYFTTKQFDSVVLEHFNKNVAMQSTVHMKVFKLKDVLKARILEVDSEGILKPFVVKDENYIILEHVNAETGVVQDLNFDKRSAKLIIDGTFAFGKIKLDLGNIDFYLVNANAVEGPQEINIVYSKIPIDEWGSIALISGAAKAVELAAKEFEKNNMLWKKLQKKLIDAALKIKNVKLNGSLTQRVSNNVNIQVKNIEGEAMALALDLRNVQCFTGSACSSQTLEASHVLLAMGQRPEEAHGSLRFTFGSATTEKDIDKVIKELPIVISELIRITVSE